MTDFTAVVNVSNLPFVEELYARYRRDPTSVDDGWRTYFEQIPDNGSDPLQGPRFEPPTLFGGRRDADSAAAGAGPLHDRFVPLLREYRVRGHLRAKLDPLGFERDNQPNLDPGSYGICEADLDRRIACTALHTDQELSVRELIASLERTYCGCIGTQYMHIDDPKIRRWLEERLEMDEHHVRPTRKQQLLTLTKLTETVTIEEFIQKKYPGAKSFSLEGSESLIPLMTTAIETAADDGVDDLAIGMAHRGRLNVLVNILGKDPAHIFREFDDPDPSISIGRGDVKYHLGFSSQWLTAHGNEAHISLCFNPSHLEYVNPVALGRTRAKQDRAGDQERGRKMCILIHGDAAFAGEGIIPETLNLSELQAYHTGGTLHIVVNNQIGFTTSPAQSRSTTYATDVAKMLQIPIFHVNGECADAAFQAVTIAMQFRRAFRRDVVIDMVGYRRWGHNEGDEPAFTQPLLYRAIRQRKSVREGYLEHLLALGEVTRNEADEIHERVQARFESEFGRVHDPDYRSAPASTLRGVWAGYRGGTDRDTPEIDTGLPLNQAKALLKQLCFLPEGFTPHPKIERLLGQRAEMAAGNRPLDWGAGELLAFASLAVEGSRIRMTGQDVERGTFSHRHAVIHDQNIGSTYCALQHLSDDQADVEIANSSLSEAAVLGFEYGYSLDWPDGLVLWEAQFGDFANCAQVIFDQFISSSEDKWNRLSGLTMLLPHGFEGMGPEHSSARIERFLDLCAEDNWQVVQPTTSAQYFHLLRRQVLRKWRKPLVCFTPKSLLRFREAASSIEEFTVGRFARVLADTRPKHVETTRRILLCTGKVYYELVAERDRRKTDDVAIVRLEQLYPFPFDELGEALADYAPETPVLWVQEEPENMGTWRYLRNIFVARLLDRFVLFALCRPESASPATGSKSSHALEERWLVSKAFDMALSDASKRQQQDETEIANSRPGK